MNNFWENKKVIVTGAAGFIGSHVVDALVIRNAQVTAVVSPTTSDKDLHVMLGQSLEKIQIKKADLLSLEDCLDITKGQEIVLNFAAMDGGSSFKQKYPAKIFKINTEIVTHMLEASVANGVDRFLLISSIEVYPKNVSSPVKEEYSLKENFQEEANGYTWSKRFGEIAAKMYTQEYGLHVAIARMGNVYGPRDYVDVEKGRVIPIFTKNVLERKPLTIYGTGQVKRSFLYVIDAVNTLLSLVELYPTCDPVNIVSSNYISIKNLAKTIGKMAKVKTIINFIPSASKVIDRKISNEKAKKVIQFMETVSLNVGLKITSEYFRNRNVNEYEKKK